MNDRSRDQPWCLDETQVLLTVRGIPLSWADRGPWLHYTASGTGQQRMPQHARRKRDNAAASPRKTKQTTTVPAPAGEPPQLEEQEEERKKSRLYLLLFVPILLLIASDSLVTFLYVRALDPLYGSVPIDLYIDKVVWAATIIGAFGPVPPLWLSFAVFGGLVTLIPTSSYWVALYTGRIENPAIGATVTHLIVLFPVIYIGVSLVKRITVWRRDSFILFTRSQYLGCIRGIYNRKYHYALYDPSSVCYERYRSSTSLEQLDNFVSLQIL